MPTFGENILFPGAPIQTTGYNINWPEYGSNPYDRGDMSYGMYDPITGLPTGQPAYNPYPYTPPDMPAANIGAYPWAYSPGAPTNPAAAAQPVGGVDGGMLGQSPVIQASGSATLTPEQRALLGGAGTPQEYAEINTSWGTPGEPNYQYWYDLQQSDPTWDAEQQAQYLAAFYGQTDAQGNLTAVGNPRPGDPYQVMPYWKYNKPTWIGGSNGKTSMGRGRRPGRYYIPEQQVYKTPGGDPMASREGYEDALYGEQPEDDGKPKGNNKIIPIWAGPLVNWRK